MKLLILNTDYPEFLRQLYAQHPGLERQPYEHQMWVRSESMYSIGDFYASNLRKLGHEAWEIDSNNEFVQKTWADEHELRIDCGHRWQFRLRKGLIPWVSRATNRQWVDEIMTAQIKHYKPDVLLNAAINGISTDFLQGIKPHVKLLVGEHAATRLPETGNWSVYDLVISSFPPTLDWFRSKGVPAELSRLAFEPRVLSHLKKNGERKIARKSRHVPRRPHEATRQRNCPRLWSPGHRAFQSPPTPWLCHARSCLAARRESGPQSPCCPACARCTSPSCRRGHPSDHQRTST